MKKTLLIFVSLTTILNAVKSTGKDLDNGLELDPRQFISIYEVRDLKKEKIELWKWQDDFTNNQLRNVIDENSIVRIEFDTAALSEAVDFKGTISIQASIIGEDGSENPAEVLPYTKVGENITTIGTPTRPSREIAQIFINLMLESYSFINSYSQYRGDIENYGTVYYEFKRSDRNKLKTPSKRELVTTLENLELLIEYIEFFKESGENAEDAFLSLISFDYISLDKLEEQIINGRDKIAKELDKDSDLDSTVIEEFDNIVRILGKLNRLNGTPFGDILFDLISSTEVLAIFFDTDTDEILLEEGRRFHFDGNGIEIGDDYVLLNSSTYQIVIERVKVKLIDEIAIRASKQIFIDLDYATVDLLKEGGKNGDVLYLNVIVAGKSKRSSNTPSSITQKVFPIGRYKLRKTGWKADVSDSFLLINRLNESAANNINSLSPSNFKGAPGVTLNATFLNNGNPKNWFINFVEPSIGVDVSYVDFDTEKDVEIGVGVVIGFFNNKIFGTIGLNLNSTGGDENEPYYFGLGFSFAKLGNKLLK